jgi:hypothetical protein
MKPLIGSALALALLSTTGMAQTVIELNPQQRTMVWERLLPPSQKQPSATFEIGVGTAVPQTVELYPVPADFEVEPLRRYRYVVIDNRMAFVDPTTRKIVHVIER